MQPPLTRHESSSGVRIYRLPCEVFPGFWAYVHLLLGAGEPTLVDTGSGFGQSNAQIFAGLETIASDFGEPITLADVKRIVITHGHIDHLGGLPVLAEKTAAEIVVHELDARILTAYAERVAVATRGLLHFLAWAGVEGDERQAFMEMYGFSKLHVKNLTVHRIVRDGDELDGLRFIHTPGHCPGQVCIAVGDVLLSADQVLPITSPHQVPESIMPYTGLGHYLESLAKVQAIGGFTLALGGHEPPIRELYRRIDDIRTGHERKLDKIVDILRSAGQPLSISQISREMYTRVEGFDVLLAVEEVGAHVEYLYQHARLAIANVDELDAEATPAVLYAVA